MRATSQHLPAGEESRSQNWLLATLACLAGCLLGRRRNRSAPFCGCMRVRMPDAHAYTAWAKESGQTEPAAVAGLRYEEIRFTSPKVIQHESSNAEYYEADYPAHRTETTGGKC